MRNKVQEAGSWGQLGGRACLLQEGAQMERPKVTEFPKGCSLAEQHRERSLCWEAALNARVKQLC